MPKLSMLKDINGTGKETFLVKDLSNIGGAIELTPSELQVLCDNLKAIDNEIKRLEKSDQPTLDPAFQLSLSRTKTFKVTKENNRVVCGLIRPCVLSSDQGRQLCILLSTQQWKQMTTVFKHYLPHKLVASKRPVSQMSEDTTHIPLKKPHLEKDCGPLCEQNEDNSSEFLEDENNNHLCSEQSTSKLSAYQWKWVNPTTQEVLEQASRWWLDPARCAENAIQNRPKQLVKFQVEVKDMDSKELIKTIYFFLIKKEITLLKLMNCSGCDFLISGQNITPSQRSHVDGCLQEGKIVIDRYLETASSNISGTKIMNIFLKLKKEHCYSTQINVNDFMFIMNYQPSLDYVRARLLSYDTIPCLVQCLNESMCE